MKSVFKDLMGQRFGRLVVVGLYERAINNSGNVEFLWICECDCGNKNIIIKRDVI
jgi:hypothetical protein